LSLLTEAALLAAVSDGVIPPFNDGGKKVNIGGVGSKDGANMLVAQHQPPMPIMNTMLNQFVGNGTVHAAEINRTSLMATAAQAFCLL
jgi:hypothetical protein